MLLKTSETLGDKLYPEKKYLKILYGLTEGTVKFSDFILKRGIVIDVLREVHIRGQEPTLAPYSLKIKIIGEDRSSNNDPKKEANIKWFPPLLSIHQVAIPEVGEEVFIIKEQTNNVGSIGYWIGRVNESFTSGRYLARTFAGGNLPSLSFKGKNIAVLSSSLSAAMNPNNKTVSIYNTSGNVNSAVVNALTSNINNVAIDKFRNIIPIRDGDVISQGRTNTFFRQSYNPRNLNGYLELGIKDQQQMYFLNGVSSSIGFTKTKTLHGENINLNEITNFSPYNKKINLDNKNIIANISEKIINISYDATATNKLYRQVLGEKLNEFFTTIIGELKNIYTLNYNLINLIAHHQHAIKGFKTDTKLIRINNTHIEKIDFNIAAKTTEVTNNNTSFIALNALSQQTLTRIDSMINKLGQHLSNNQFLN